MRRVYLNPTNFRQQYVTTIANDPNVPAGWVLTSGSDGAADAAIQTLRAGVNSGGYPPYTRDQTQRADWPNGIFTSKPGGSPTGG